MNYLIIESKFLLILRRPFLCMQGIVDVLTVSYWWMILIILRVKSLLHCCNDTGWWDLFLSAVAIGWKHWTYENYQSISCIKISLITSYIYIYNKAISICLDKLFLLLGGLYGHYSFSYLFPDDYCLDSFSSKEWRSQRRDS